MKIYFYPAIVLLAALGWQQTNHAQDWTRFRGPNGTGISRATTIPTRWSPQDINWKVELPGNGQSSPVVWGNKIFLTSTSGTEGQRSVYALDTDQGELLWEWKTEFDLYRQHQYNSFASSSPAVDAERVYVCWTTPDQYILMALTHQGEVVWKRDLGPYSSQHGGGTSPIVYEDKVILANDQKDEREGQSFLIAVDAATGKTVWKTPRRSVRAAYSTPCVYNPPGEKPSLIFNSWTHGISAVDPDTGNVLWQYDQAFDKRSVSSPVLASGVIIGTCGSGGGGNYVVAIRPGNRQGKQPELAYEIRRAAPYVPTGIAWKGWVFLWNGSGIVTCIDAPTGEVRWRERVPGDYFGSPVCVDGRLFAISTNGDVVVLKASDQFRQLAVNSLGEKSHATPAIADGVMYVRTWGHLYSIGGNTAATAKR
jgi:outer membrane protein assembly factor BamB